MSGFRISFFFFSYYKNVMSDPTTYITYCFFFFWRMKPVHIFRQMSIIINLALHDRIFLQAWKLICDKASCLQNKVKHEKFHCNS